MRLAAKLIVALVIGITIVLVVQAALHLRRVSEMQQRQARADLEELAHNLAAATSELWRAGGRSAVQRYLKTTNERRSSATISLKEERVKEGGEPARLGGAWVVAVPIVVDGEQVATISIRRELASGASDDRSVLLGQLGTTAALVMVSALIVVLLGGWLIGRPVDKLIVQARRVAEGDYSAKVEVRQRDELGRLASELGTMTDQLARSRDQLAEQRRARAALQQQLRHADRLSTVGKLASGIAHELGTPLNVVAGRASMILATPELSPEVVDNARIVVDQAQRMTGIIRELLDFARRHGPRRQQASVEEVLEQACTLIEPIAEGAEVSLRHDAPRDMTASLDVGKTLQVLTNLVMNAVQAMPRGGTVVLRAREEQVDRPPDDHAEPGGYVVFSVVDEGPGIAADDLEHIFQPFFTTKRAGRGTGLGLYVCHGIIREQQGWIQVDSELGVGSEFHVFLPKGDGEGQSHD